MHTAPTNQNDGMNCRRAEVNQISETAPPTIYGSFSEDENYDVYDASRCFAEPTATNEPTPAPTADPEPSEFYCLEGDGGPCYPASTSCFPSCPDMGNWHEGNGYSNTYESFQDFCRNWSANNGNFYGGVGSCPGTTRRLAAADNEAVPGRPPRRRR